MSMPPQGGWPPQGPPPNYGPPNYGPPPQQPPPPGWQQGPWPPQEPRPDFAPQKSNSIKWLLIGIAVLLVVGVSIGATLLFTRDSGGGGATPTSGAPSDFASASDKAPVAIVAEEPTCEAMNALNTRMAAVESNGWVEQRASLGSASEWTPEQRTQVAAVATAIRNSADQMVGLAKQTPHRLVRELYQQAIVFGRAYADGVPNYTPADNHLADVYVNGSNAIYGICNSIQYGSASRALAVEPVAAPSQVTNPTNLDRFIDAPSPLCTEWVAGADQFEADLAQWSALDANTPGSQWTPEERSIHAAALPIFSSRADAIETVAEKSGNPIYDDFASAAALYLRAYVSAGDSYITNDSSLFYTAFRLSNVITTACQAAGS